MAPGPCVLPRLRGDSIHMTTYPLGYLTAAWIACEDIHPDCGSLVYYPGSHKLPYVFSKDAGISETDFKIDGYKPYHAKYEPLIQESVSRIAPQYFHARKGDVLIWHANLIHGGSPRKNLDFSRHSIVCHYFVKDRSSITTSRRLARKANTWAPASCATRPETSKDCAGRRASTNRLAR